MRMTASRNAPMQDFKRFSYSPPCAYRRKKLSGFHFGRSASLATVFFFQAEDGIRDDLVTGVQTCALPIFQENGPERPDFKMKLFADMDDAAPIDSIIASSSSGITPSVMQSKSKHPERILVGHPFNPSHIIPLVEVVGGTKTSPEAIQQALAFYASIGKKPIQLKKELPGHVGNRLQAALYKEIMYLIQHDVLSVEDADVAVSYGPGPRWGVMGPSLQWHLGGGAGGIKHFMDHLMDPLTAMIKTLGTPDVTPELKQTIVEGVLREAGNRSVDDLAQEENGLLIGLLRSRAQTNNGATKAKQAAA